MLQHTPIHDLQINPYQSNQTHLNFSTSIINKQYCYKQYVCYNLDYQAQLISQKAPQNMLFHTFQINPYFNYRIEFIQIFRHVFQLNSYHCFKKIISKFIYVLYSIQTTLINATLFSCKDIVTIMMANTQVQKVLFQKAIQKCNLVLQGLKCKSPRFQKDLQQNTLQTYKVRQFEKYLHKFLILPTNLFNITYKYSFNFLFTYKNRQLFYFMNGIFLL
eukprot:TRINITY_DN2905_c0_g1_i11.p1 TRINITY_DN2905_c0_g1~~TRINITY_DN2905_c0_g1_i11.p1  ORF type:complete len:218 (+),score=-23.73 TRINITY_DN2905_c0_g1_i11:428-1081(+)